MIANLSGKIIDKEPTTIVIECGGVGYFLNISLTTSESIGKVGENVSLMTEMIVREDSMQLYGFISKSEKTVFKELITVSGIGARIAINILSAVNSDILVKMIVAKELNSLIKLPGIGKKTAERIIVELADKLGKSNLHDSSLVVSKVSNAKTDAVQALITLGFNAKTAENAIEKASKELTEPFKIEDLIKIGLKHTLK